ncbi:hypothetical protein BDV09DRAFT_195115 [Aspergillus tetrazonus]
MSVFSPTEEAAPDPRIIHQNTTSLTLNEATRTRYNRAISNLSSLTDQNGRLIHRPQAEEENTLSRDTCGLFMDELIGKAVNSITDTATNTNNDDNDRAAAADNGGPRNSHSLGLTLPLSYEEARLLSAGVRNAVQLHLAPYIAAKAMPEPLT